MKSVKGLEAYRFYESGWVQNVHCLETTKGVVLAAKVMHSRRLNEEPLRPRVFSEKNGNIICAHCNCMAGYVFCNVKKCYTIYILNTLSVSYMYQIKC